ncbi:hypothetical protein [Actinoplanes subglobosus]|uniref:Uncharacterized protein n=1 Tax=Actinoplanes subglobosus TaxID=1547892 RepID=A0ABV8IVT8_9ACTN
MSHVRLAGKQLFQLLDATSGRVPHEGSAAGSIGYITVCVYDEAAVTVCVYDEAAVTVCVYDEAAVTVCVYDEAAVTVCVYDEAAVTVCRADRPSQWAGAFDDTGRWLWELPAEGRRPARCRFARCWFASGRPVCWPLARCRPA